MACAVLVAQGYSAPDALRIVRRARWQALPNDRQLAALVDFERNWRNRASAGAVDNAAALHDSSNGFGQTQPANVGDDVAST